MYSGIFLMFAPMGVLMMMVNDPPQGWLAALLAAAFTGGMSVGWAHTFVRRRWWLLIPLSIVPFVLSPFFTLLAHFGLFSIGYDYPRQTKLIILAVICVVFTSIGFILSVMHLRKSERIGARAMAELDMASQVHASLVPAISITTPFAQVHGRSAASSSMGGDLIDAVIAPGSDRLDVLLGDVSGHGVSAGVVMAMLKGCVRTRLLRAADLGEMVADTNTVLSQLIEPHMFATFVALRINSVGRTPGHRRLEYALAGHLPVFHYRAAEQRWDQHPNESLPLGVDSTERFATGSTDAAPGDLLVVFTDGLMEVQNSAGKELGLGGVAALLEAHPADQLEAIHEKIMAGVNAHGPQLDDQSLLLVRIM
jgi:sigma-B regulation protein RsbU (phosphoserine phosphatase)